MIRSTFFLRALALALVAGLAGAPSIAAPKDTAGGTTSNAAERELALTDLVMGDKDDARSAIALGPMGEVYAPTKGEWTRAQAITTSDKITSVGRASGVVVLADGAVYKLADNGWSALRLTQKGKAVMSSGARSVGAVGKQLFALDRSINGEPQKLGQAPGNVVAIGASEKSIVIATDRGLFRSSNSATTGIATTGTFKPLARAPKRVDRLLDDKFALIDRGVVDLDTGAVTAWPAGFHVGAATVAAVSRGALDLEGAESVSASATAAAATAAASGADDDAAPTARGVRSGAKGKNVSKAGAKGAGAAKTSKTPSPNAVKAGSKAPTAKKGSGALVIAVGTLRGVPTLVVVDGAAIQTETIDIDATAVTTGASGPNGGAGASGPSSAKPSRKSAPSSPIGVVADRAGRIAVAFANGSIALREKKAWTTSLIDEALAAPMPGSPPASSGPPS